jgi:hypothetical protein
LGIGYWYYVIRERQVRDQRDWNVRISFWQGSQKMPCHEFRNMEITKPVIESYV